MSIASILEDKLGVIVASSVTVWFVLTAIFHGRRYFCSLYFHDYFFHNHRSRSFRIIFDEILLICHLRPSNKPELLFNDLWDIRHSYCLIMQ